MVLAFIHHSNWLNSGETGENPHSRAVSVSAEAVAKLVQESGGIVLITRSTKLGHALLHRLLLSLQSSR